MALTMHTTNPLASLSTIMGPVIRAWRAMRENPHSKHLSTTFDFDAHGVATIAEAVISLRQEDGEASEAFLARVYTTKQLANAQLEVSMHDGRTTAKIISRGPTSDAERLTQQVDALTLQVAALAAYLERAPEIVSERTLQVAALAAYLAERAPEIAPDRR